MATQYKEDKNITFDINSILKDITRRWLLILLCACVFSMGFYIYAQETYSPSYTSKITFIINDKNENRNTYTNLTTTTTLADVFKRLINSEQLKSKTAENLGYSSFPGNVTATQVPETNLLTLSVTSSSPKLSFELINGVLDTYPTFTNGIMSNAVMEVLEPPTVQVGASNSSNSKQMALYGFAIGTALSVFIIVVFSFFKDTVKNEDEIEKKLNTHKAISIPREKKKHRIRNFFTRRKTPLNINNPTQGFSFVESFKKLRTIVETKGKKHNYKTFIVTSTLENEGKSTIAANIAIALAKKDLKVLIIDADLRKPAVSKFFDMEVKKEQNLYQFLKGEARLSDILIYDKKLNLSFIVDDSYRGNSTDLLSSDRMEYLISTVKEHFDYIIIDTAPLGMVSDTEEILEYCDAAFLVVRQDMAKSIAINDTIDIINHSNSKLLGCVFNDAKKAFDNQYGYGYYGYYG